MILDATLSLRDEGLSAYHQRHITQGALGAFLRSVDAGLVAPGSVLVVEGLDRLSRAEPVLAQAQLAQIVNAGITVVTASDGREYNRASLKAQPMDLVYSLLVMIRAHEESDTKSKRVKAAIRRQCLAWQAGTYRGIIRNGKDPAWVAWNGTSFEFVTDRADAMRAAISLFLQGNGAKRVMAGLIEREFSPDSFPATGATFYKILKRQDLIGTKMLELDGDVFELRGYYPSLINKQDYQQLQTANMLRKKRAVKGQIPGLITGMSMLYCGYCGAAVIGQNLMTHHRKPDGTPQDGHRRLMCSSNSLGVRCSVGGSVSVVPVERALFAFCSDQLNLNSLASDGDHTVLSRTALARARQAIADLDKQLTRVTAALLADDEATPLAFVRKAREIESKLAEARRDEASADAELSRTAHRNTPAIAEQWGALKSGALTLDYDSRIRVRQMVGDTFERIVIYHRGMDPTEGKHVDLLLIAKGGATRQLRIDRKTGTWVAQRD